MTPQITGKDLHPNEIIIEIERCSPPTMTLTERARLAQSCKDADFQMPDKDILEFPCVKAITTRTGRGHCGLAILARSGIKAEPRYTILQPPIDEVTKDHDGSKYVYASLVAIFIIKCWKNNVYVKIRYKDKPNEVYMVSADDIRLYQDPYIQIPD